MRPDIDAGPIGRKCSVSNGPSDHCPALPAARLLALIVPISDWPATASITATPRPTTRILIHASGLLLRIA